MMRDVFCGIQRDTLRHALCFLAVCALACFAVLACASKAQNQDDNQEILQQAYRHSGSYGNLVFVGVSGRFANREDSINNALKDAARKFSFYHSVSGNYTLKEQTGGSVFDVRFTSEYQLQYDEDLEKYVELLEFDPARDVFENNNALFVITRAPSGPTMPMALGHSSGGSRPLWVDAPPIQIGGFVVGVGHSNRQSSHSDTVVISYERAVISIIGNMGSHISGGIHSYEDTSTAFGTSHLSASETTVSGSIKNFYVIESWTDPLKLSVWTLAIASNDN